MVHSADGEAAAAFCGLKSSERHWKEAVIARVENLMTSCNVKKKENNWVHNAAFHIVLTGFVAAVIMEILLLWDLIKLLLYYDYD